MRMLRVSHKAGNCLAVVAVALVAWLSTACAADAPDVALRVNGHPVTHGEIADAKARFATGMDAMKEQIDIADPSVKPSLEELVRVNEKYGVDAAVLGGIVNEYAEYDAAIKAGFGASDDEVAEVVSTMRGQHEQVLQMIEEYGIDESTGCINMAGIDESDGCIDVAGIGELGSVAEYIEAMGEDKYWDEILPAEIRRNVAVGKWRDAAYLELAAAQEGYGEGGVKREEWARIRRAVALSALADVEVEVVDKALFDEATVAEALGYGREVVYALYPD